LLVIAVLLAIVSESWAQKEQLKNGQGSGGTASQDGSGSSQQEDNGQDIIKQKPPKPSGRRRGFKENGNAKFMAEIGPDLAEQLLIKAGNLNQPTLEEPWRALESLMSRSNDVVSSQAGLLLYSSCFIIHHCYSVLYKRDTH
jgi:hypothetical protein